MNIFSSTFTQILSSLVGLTGDWFIAIALVTLGIKFVLLPFTIKQHRAQLISANINQARVILASKFHNQTEKVNSELLKIVSKYNINPLTSFITLIIQAPVFFSLYFAVNNISTSVGSFLIPWVLNLHTADSLHILPIIAGLLQGISGFSVENKNLLMFILPVAMGVLFLWKAPVALSAYWIVNTSLRYIEIKIFSLNPIRRRLFNIPSPDEMVK